MPIPRISIGIIGDVYDLIRPRVQLKQARLAVARVEAVVVAQ